MSGSDIAVRVARIDTVAERVKQSDWYVQTAGCCRHSPPARTLS